MKFISVPQAVDASVPSAHPQDEEGDKPPVVTGPVPTWPGYQLQPHENVCSEPRCCGCILLAHPQVAAPWPGSGVPLGPGKPWPPGSCCLGHMHCTSRDFQHCLSLGGCPPPINPDFLHLPCAVDAAAFSILSGASGVIIVIMKK